MHQMQKFLGDLKKVLGENAVIDSSEQVAYKTQETCHVTHQPQGLVYPSSVEEVQHIVRLANKYKCKIFPCSRGFTTGHFIETILK